MYNCCVSVVTKQDFNKRLQLTEFEVINILFIQHSDSMLINFPLSVKNKLTYFGLYSLLVITLLESDYIPDVLSDSLDVCCNIHPP